MDSTFEHVTSLSQIHQLAIEAVNASCRLNLIVAPAPDRNTMEGIKLAIDAGLVRVTIVGDEAAIRDMMKAIGCSKKHVKVINKESDSDSVVHATIIGQKSEDVLLLPGQISVPDYFHHLFSPKSTFRQRSDFMSLVGVMERPGEEGLILLSDVGLVPDPTVEQGISILKNAVTLARILGKKTIRVGLLAFEDDPSPNSPTTVAESMISRYFNEKGDATVCVEGPIRLDRALGPKAIPCMPIPTMEQGPADILIANNIHVGNSMYKAMVTLCKMSSAPVVMGGCVPIALPSSSESATNITNSIALAVLVRRSPLFSQDKPQMVLMKKTADQ